MKREQRAHRLALTMLTAAVIFVMQVLAVGISAVVVTVLARAGFLSHGPVSYTHLTLPTICSV